MRYIVLLATLVLIFLGATILFNGFRADQICDPEEGCLNGVLDEVFQNCMDESCEIALQEVAPGSNRAFILPRFNLLDSQERSKYSNIIGSLTNKLKLFDSCSYIVFDGSNGSSFLLSECDPFWVEEIAMPEMNIAQPFFQIYSPQDNGEFSLFYSVLELPMSSLIRSDNMLLIE